MSRVLTVPPVRAAAKRILGVIISILFGTVCATTRAQSLPVNPYQHLDDAARVAHDARTVGLLVDDVYGTALFGRLSPRLTERIVRAELSFQGGAHPAITEKALADAVNALGTSEVVAHIERRLIQQIIDTAQDLNPGDNMSPKVLRAIAQQLGSRDVRFSAETGAGGSTVDLTDILYQSDREYISALRGQDFLYQFQSEFPASNAPARSREAAICRANSLGVL